MLTTCTRRRLRRVALPGLALAALVLPSLRALHRCAAAPQPAFAAAPSEGAHGRREALGAGVVAGLLGAAPPLALGPLPARAEQAWQLQKPRTWEVFQQTPPPPPGEKRPVALVVAGNAEKGGELAVLRVPLSTNPSDPNAAMSKKLIEYFATPMGKTPSVSKDAAVEVLTSSQKTQQGLTSWGIVSKPAETIKFGRRYLSYEFESSLCQGIVTQTESGSTCQEESGAVVPTLNRHHAITLTVSKEGTPDDYLWVLDTSGPSEVWKDPSLPQDVKTEITDVAASFALGEETELEAARTVKVTKEQAEEMKRFLEAAEKEGIRFE